MPKSLNLNLTKKDRDRIWQIAMTLVSGHSIDSAPFFNNAYPLEGTHEDRER